MIKIFHADALDLLRSLPSDSVDAIITDPPYGVNYVHNPRTGSAGFDDDSFSVECLARSVCPEIMRVLRPGGVVYMYVGQACPVWDYWLMRSGLRIVNRLALRAFAAPASDGVYMYSAQLMVYACKGSPRFVMPVRDWEAPDMESFNSVLVPNLRRSPGDSEHPCAKNPATLMHFMRMSIPRGGLVVDPFVGGGSTALAAFRCGMRFVGSEVNRDYFEMLCHKYSDWCSDVLSPCV